MASPLSKVQPFLEDAREQLVATNHFGALGSLLSTQPPVTRFDYVMHHAALLLQVKQAVPGLGLGSKNGFRRVDPQRDDFGPLKEWTGLEVCQAWAVLLNAGHLFGTFATERSLLFHLDRDLADRETFIRLGVDFDQSQGNKLRGIVERALNEARVHSFFYLLALWRLRTTGASQLSDGDRHVARLLVKSFLAPPSPAVEGWVEIFRRTRQLTYLQLHRNLPGVKYTVASDDVSDDDLRELFPNDSLPDEDWVAKSRWQVLDSIDRHDHVRHFSSTAAAAEVLAHVDAFKPWWNNRRAQGEGFASLLDQLFQKPADWSETREPYEAVACLRVPARLDWLTETRLWLRDQNRSDPWDGSNFLVSPDPRGGLLSVDLYAGRSGFSLGALRHSILQLSRAFTSGHRSADNVALWMSAARLCAHALESTLKVEYVVRLEPTPGSADHVGYASVGESYEIVRGLVKGFLVSCTDSGRESELRQLLAVTDKLTAWRTPAIVILARTLIVDAGSNQVAAELDGVCGLFENGGLRWIVVECKKKDAGDGEKQLREKLEPCLTSGLDSVQHVTNGGFESWHASVLSPPILRREPPGADIDDLKREVELG